MISSSGYHVLLESSESIKRRDIKFIKFYNGDDIQHSAEFIVSSSRGEFTAFDGT